MPMLIYTIGDYFAEKRKDLHFIQFKNATEDNWEELPERKMIWDWFENNLPNTKIFAISEAAQPGLLSAEYKGSIGIEFDDESLAAFIKRWEDGNDTSVDPRFQCYFLPLEDYIKRFGEDILNFDYEMI